MSCRAYRDRVVFQVSKALLERAVLETYAIELDDLLLNVDLAIGSYRRAVGTTIPELTRIAWREKRDEIEQRTPGISERTFVYVLSRRDYEREFGTKYRKPGVLARVLAFVLKVVPKVGPFRPLAFEPLTAEVDRLFLDSVAAARARYQTALQALRANRLSLPNTDFDTGRRPTLGENRLADETYADLLHKLARRDVDLPSRLRQELNGFFGGLAAHHTSFSRKESARLQNDLAVVNRR
jgi:hypothetical protein